MFGTTTNDSQPHGGPVTAPTNGTHSINDDIPQAPPEEQATNNDPNTVFPPSNSNDPFGTTPIIDDPAAMAEPQAANDYQSQTHQAQQANPAPQAQIPAGEDLIGIKQQALEELSPLVKHLNQTPEEKYKTTMMMIQATDDQSLVQEAFDAAKEIKDDKARAQALLDIINEINYFTQNHDE